MSQTDGQPPPVMAKAGAGRPAAASPATPAVPAVTREEVEVLVRRAGLTLNAGQKADLAVAYQHLVTLAARIPRARPIWDPPCFTAPPSGPLSAAAAGEAAAPARPGRRAARAASGPRAKPAAAARPAAGKPAKPARAAKPAKKAGRPRR